ncbi:MAG TPA: alpha/beta fold hydrolase [Terriglobales bacterium]|nr:alpha/beta fold hydrolase [Terriglobales bacterium]
MGSHQIHEPFLARRMFRGGHRQTLANFFLLRRFHLPKAEERLIEVEPGVQVLCHCHWQPDRERALTVLVVHGLEGSSDSGYALGIAAKGLAAGMNVIRMNQRNCGGTNHLAPTLYHSGRSSDIAQVVRALIEQDKICRLALVGFSMGGNLILKLAGEWSTEGPREFCAAAAVCPSMDLAASADALHEPGNRVYEYYFLMKLRRRWREKAKLFPGHYDATKARRVTSLRDFDDKVTAPYCGFSGAADYYERSSASRVIDRIAVPTLILHATNDPFIRITTETRTKIAGNPHIAFHESEDGGHCSFLANANGYDGRWAEREVIEFLRGVREVVP